MADSLVCRGCRHLLLDEAGCALCLPVKPHLMPIEVADDDAVPLAQLASETAILLRAQLKQLKMLQKASSGYDVVLADQSRAHANVLAKLLDASRKVIQDGADAVDSMSFTEKAALFTEWFAALPPAYRRRLHDSLAGHIVTALPDEPALQEPNDTSVN